MIPNKVVESNRIDDTIPLESGKSFVKIIDWQITAVPKSKTPNKTSEIRKGMSPTLS